MECLGSLYAELGASLKPTKTELHTLPQVSFNLAGQGADGTGGGGGSKALVIVSQDVCYAQEFGQRASPAEEASALLPICSRRF